MRILWVSTSPMGPAARILNLPHSGSSGGWIQSEYEDFLKTATKPHQMFFLCGSRSVKAGKIKKAESHEGKAYCVNLPSVSFGLTLPKKTQKNVETIIQEIKPDVIHIWGTESSIDYGVIKAAPSIKTVVFIQGILGVHQRYLGGYLGRMPDEARYGGRRNPKEWLADALRAHFFKKQVEKEKEILCSAAGVIIDSDFAASYCQTVSPDIPLFRRFLKPNPVFQTGDWSHSTCIPNTIFTLFAASPEKGLHQLLKALVLVKKAIPNVKLIIPGPFTAKNGKLLPRRQLSVYERVVSDFITQNHLAENVVFTGTLTAEQMAEQLHKANLYVCPSCMEVHAGSLREAMAVGMPVITAHCGSVMEFVAHQKNGLIYRYEEYETLAMLIKLVLQDEKLAHRLSQNAGKTIADFSARKTKTLEEIYQTL